MESNNISEEYSQEALNIINEFEKDLNTENVLIKLLFLLHLL